MSISAADKQLWLETPGNLRCGLFELTFLGNNGGAAGEFKTRIANMPFITGASDTPAHTPFEDCVLSMPEFSWMMGEQLAGRSTQSFGELIVANDNGVRTSWLTMNWDGRRLRHWIGDPSWNISDFILVLDGVIVDIFDAGENKIGFHISDKSALLDRDIMNPRALLGGTGPQAGDLMPLIYGYVTNITPKCIDPINHVYRMTWTSVGAGTADEFMFPKTPSVNPFDVREDGVSLQDASGNMTVTAVNVGTDTLTAGVAHGFVKNTRVIFFNYGSGVLPSPLVFGTEYWVIAAGLTSTDFRLATAWDGTQIDLTGTLSGDVRVESWDWTSDPSAGTFKLPTNPVGLITCDCSGLVPGTSPAVPNDAAGQIIQQVLTSPMLINSPLTISDLDTTSINNFVAACPQRLSIYITERMTFADLLDKMVLSVGGWWGFSRDGKLQMGRLDLPAPGTPVYSFLGDDFALRSLKISRRILPRTDVKIIGVTNWTQQSVVAGSVSETNRAAYIAPNLVVTGNATVTTWDTDPKNHKGASKVDPLQTYMAFVGDLSAEATRLATMFQYPTAIITVDTHQAIYLLKRGDLIYVSHPRYTGYAIVVGGIEKAKGKCSLDFFVQLKDTYPTGDIV